MTGPGEAAFTPGSLLFPSLPGQVPVGTARSPSGAQPSAWDTPGFKSGSPAFWPNAFTSLGLSFALMRATLYKELGEVS